MEAEIKQRIIPVDIEDEMRNSYLDYAMSVIVGRALPDIRDGLKPVHRRILYAMYETGNNSDKPYRKSARIVGDVLGKYHPHGEASVYEALVRMEQDFSTRYPLIDGQGNFGSIDGDPPAAMRYTEVRMAKISEELVADIDKNTVDFIPNYDESLKEPTVLSSKIPNLLLNGSSGIAVGMATNIPPHNLKEIVEAIIKYLANSEISMEELMESLPGPDFPTGGLICGRDGIREAYRTGRGMIQLRARSRIEKMKNGRECIIITEIPYQVNKTHLLEKMADLVREKKIDGITDLRDESDREGMRIVIEIRREENPAVILNQLYKHTQLQTTFGIIFLALVKNRPQILNLKQMIQYYAEHRQNVILRRTHFDLAGAQRRAHLVEGLRIAQAHLEEVVKIIRSAKNAEEARLSLQQRFGLSEEQSKAILEMRLQQLTGLERQKLEDEYLELIKTISYLTSIINNIQKVREIIKEELEELKKKYGDPRRTEILDGQEEIKVEDLITEEEVIINISHSGYIKRIPLSTYRQQRRGGIGVTGADMKEEDFIKELFISSTHDTILFFSNRGKCYPLKVHEIPEGGRVSRGKAIVNLLPFNPDESITATILFPRSIEGGYLLMVTRQGKIKKTELRAFQQLRRSGITAIHLQPKDELVEAISTNGKEEIIIATRLGKAIRFSEVGVRPMRRGARGVKGISLLPGDTVMGLKAMREKEMLLTVTEKGYGKRTPMGGYRITNRGGKGIINFKIREHHGQVAGIERVSEDDELLIMTSNGMMLRIPVKDIKISGRNTQGVRLIRLKEEDRVVAMARVLSPK